MGGWTLGCSKYYFTLPTSHQLIPQPSALFLAAPSERYSGPGRATRAGLPALESADPQNKVVEDDPGTREMDHRPLSVTSSVPSPSLRYISLVHAELYELFDVVFLGEGC